MSAIRSTPHQAVEGRQVIAWNGITTPEHRIDWLEVRKLASRCKDQTGIETDTQGWKNKMIEARGESFFYAEFNDATCMKVHNFFRSLDPRHKQLILALAKFPFGIHRCYIDAQVLRPGFVSEHLIFQRFFNPTGWMHFIEGFNHSTEIGPESQRFTLPIQTLLGEQISYPPSVILDGFRGVPHVETAKVGELILTALVHDRLLEKKLYQEVLGLTFQ
jgi:hypothetical protein